MTSAATTNKSYQWSVGMTCGGCVSQINKILTRLNDKTGDDAKFTHNVSLENKTVTVTGGAVNTDEVNGKIEHWANAKNKSIVYDGEVKG